MESTSPMVAVILAGGVGTRFWPLSTQERPKQFIPLFGDRSLLQKSYDRVAGLIPDDRILILTNAGFTSLVAEQLPTVPPENIVGEPRRKDTAAAVCLGALMARRRFGNPVMAVLTADHLIEPVLLFQRTLLSAVEAARESGALYTFGIRPTYPAAGYGYLETAEKAMERDGIEHFDLVSFREKPDVETARRYVDSGRYLWNSGMFVWTVEAVLDELERHLPEHVAHLSPAVDAMGTAEGEPSLARAFEALQRTSIDFGVMEKARKVRCVAGTFSWRDVGGWLAMQDFLACDEHENHARGCLHGLDAAGNLVFCDRSEETVALVGVRDMVVVRAGGKTLIARKDRLEDVKRLVERMLPAGNGSST